MNPTRENGNCIGLYLQPRVSPSQVGNVQSTEERQMGTDQDAKQTSHSVSKSLDGFFLTRKDTLGRYSSFFNTSSFLHDAETQVCVKIHGSNASNDLAVLRIALQRTFDAFLNI